MSKWLEVAVGPSREVVNPRGESFNTRPQICPEAGITHGRASVQVAITVDPTGRLYRCPAEKHLRLCYHLASGQTCPYAAKNGRVGKETAA